MVWCCLVLYGLVCARCVFSSYIMWWLVLCQRLCWLVMACDGLCCLVLCCLVLSCLVLSSLVLPYLALFVLSCVVFCCRFLSLYQTLHAAFVVSSDRCALTNACSIARRKSLLAFCCSSPFALAYSWIATKETMKNSPTQRRTR